MKKNLVIDGSAISDKDNLHRSFAEAFDFPEHYGANLDALFDCLGEVRCEAEIRVINARELAEKFGEAYADNFRSALLDAEREFEQIHVEYIE